MILSRNFRCQLDLCGRSDRQIFFSLGTEAGFSRTAFRETIAHGFVTSILYVLWYEPTSVSFPLRGLTVYKLATVALVT